MTAEMAGAPTMRGTEDPNVRRLHVAHFHSTLGIYGAERWTLALVSHLDPEAIQTTIISIGTKPDADLFHRTVTEEGYDAFHMHVPGKLHPSAVLKLRRFLIDRRIDVLHTHGFKSDVLGYFATRGLPTRLVSTIHGWSADEGIRIQAYEAIGRTFLRGFDRIYPLSPGLLQDLERRRFRSQRLHLILNAVDLSRIEYAFRSRNPDEAFRVLFVGRVCRPKGIFELVEGFAKARFTGPAELVVVGDGPDRIEAEESARRLGLGDRIKFLGAVADIRPVMSGGNCLALPSHAEGIPRTIMEAFAHGVPVVGTAIAGIEQLVSDGQTGLLVPVNSPPALALALEKMCARPDHAAAIAERARRHVVEKYAATRMASDYEREYRELCRSA